MPLLPADYDLTVVRGDVYERLTFAMTDQDDVHVDFTGYTVAAQVRQTTEAATPLLTFTCGVDGNGDPYLEAPAEDTAAMGALTAGVWDLQLTPPAGEPRTYVRGRVAIVLDVTR